MPTFTASDRCEPSSRPGRSNRTPIPTAVPNGPRFYGEDARDAQLAFFDRHLRERDIAPLPRIRLEIRDQADHVVEVRTEQQWPLARTDWRRLYLGVDGTLGEHPDGVGSVTFDLRRDAAAFEYRFDEDTELSGPMTLRLQVAVTGTDDPRLFVGVEKWSLMAPQCRSTARMDTGAITSHKVGSDSPCATSTSTSTSTSTRSNSPNTLPHVAIDSQQ